MTNVVLSIAIMTLGLFTAWGLPFFLQEGLLSPFTAAFMMVIGLFFNLPFWSLIHEGIHGNLLGQRRFNFYLSRALSFFFGVSFTFVQSAHLTHHAMNRDPEEVPELEKGETYLRARLRYYLTLFFGIYLFEVLAPLKFIFLSRPTITRMVERVYPAGSYLRKIHERALATEQRTTLIRQEAYGLVLFWALTFFFYRQHLSLFFLFFFGRAFFISFFDNVYHYNTPLYATDSAHNLTLPAPLSLFILHFNYHHVHHQHPSWGWRQLPQKTPLIKGPSLWSALFSQLNGLVSLHPYNPQESAHEKDKFSR